MGNPEVEEEKKVNPYLKPPKVWNPADFNKFLSRQKAHDELKRKRNQDVDYMVSLRKAPLLPIISMVYRIQGGIYTEKDGVLAGSPTARSSTSQGGERRKVVEDPKFTKFLQRQNELETRKVKRSMSTDPVSSSVLLPKERIEEFLTRQKEVIAERKQNIVKQIEQDTLDVMLVSDKAKKLHGIGVKQDPAFLAKHGPKGAAAAHEKSVSKAHRKWKEQYKLEPGESEILQPRIVTPSQAEEFWQRVKDIPTVATREPPTSPEPRTMEGFKTAGNPYEGGKADQLVLRLGDRSGVMFMPSSIE